MAWRRDQSSSFISGSTIYAYTEVDWNVEAASCTYTHLGGVTSPYYWDTSATGTLFWREWSGGAWGAWNEYASGTAHFGGYGDKELVRTDGFFSRQAADREVQLACDVTAAGGTGSAWLTYTVPHLPGSPTGLTAQYVNDNRIDLSWTNPSTSYYAFCLEVRIDGGSWSQCWYYNGEGYPTSYSYTSATVDHSYEFRARTEYYSAYSAYTAATASIKTKPAAPSAISTAAIQGSTNVAVTLTNSSNVATGIQWQFSSDGSTWGASSSVSGSPVRSFTATGISGSGYIRVRNVNATGTSGWLTSQKVTTICPPAAPTLRTPSGNVVDMADGSVLFSWLHNSLDGSAQTSYELQYAINGGAAATLSGTTDQERTLSLSGFSAGDAISWKVRTKGADPSFGPWSGSLSFNLYTAPTVSITSPGATITGMPIALTATYSDMAGFTCQAATVSLTKDGRTLYSEAATINGSSITASLTTDEFLPTNGESYTVVLTARSSSSLQTTANATFTVDFTEPQSGELAISNDPDTGYASLYATFDNHASDVEYSGATNSQFDTTEGYVRSLTVEGKSEKWNQLFNRSDSGTGTGWSYTTSGSLLTITVTATTATSSGGNQLSVGSAVFKAGHKYAAFTVGDQRIWLDYKAYNNTWTPNIFTATSAVYTNIAIRFTDLPAGTYAIHVLLCDLTAIFGAGNEPATVDAFKATDIYKAKLAAGELYDYDAGSLMSIEGVGVRGRNLIPKMVAGDYSNHGITAIVDADGVLSISGTVSGGNFNTTIPLESQVTVDAVGKYFHMHNSAPLANITAIPQPSTSGVVTFDVVMPSGTADCISPAVTAAQAAMIPTIGSFRFYLANGVTNSITLRPSLEETNEQTAYEPYSLTTIETPLRSAGSIHDTLQVDVEDVSVSRKVGVVDLGSLTWGVNSLVSTIYYAQVPNMYVPTDALGRLDGILCANYAVDTIASIDSNMGNKTMKRAGGNINIRDDSYSTKEAFKTAMSGVYLFYELATPTQDTETSMSRIEIGSAFTVATDLDSTFSMTSWDGSADAVSISVARVNADGLTPLITDGASGSGVVDKYAPLNTPYQYAVTTKAASQAVKTVYVDNIFESDHWFAYWGENVAKAKWNPDNGGIQVTRPQKTRVYYAGRRDPVSYDGHAVSLTETPSWMFIGKDEVEPFVKLIEDGGRGVYKSCDGWVYHADFDLTLTPSYTAIGYYGGASLGITRIAGDRL